MDEWGWLTRAGAAVALVLSIANTAKLVVDARRAHREKKREQVVKRRLEKLLEWFDDSGGGEAFAAGKYQDDDYSTAVLLGAKLGVLKIIWHEGQMIVRLARGGDAK